MKNRITDPSAVLCRFITVFSCTYFWLQDSSFRKIHVILAVLPLLTPDSSLTQTYLVNAEHKNWHPYKVWYHVKQQHVQINSTPNICDDPLKSGTITHHLDGKEARRRDIGVRFNLFCLEGTGRHFQFSFPLQLSLPVEQRQPHNIPAYRSGHNGLLHVIRVKVVRQRGRGSAQLAGW